MTDRQWQVFFEIHRDLLREGPGSDQSTRRAYACLAARFGKSAILDVGCGPGAQTIQLTEVSGGHVLAVDNHEPFLDQLRQRAACRDRFVLPESDWWDEYHNPIQDKLQLIKDRHRNDPEALEVVAMAEAEIALFRKYSSYNGYVFYIAQKESRDVP
jgi:SAM-dependent methyltransferase